MAKMAVSALHAAAVDGTIWLLWVILNVLDAFLVALRKIASFADVITDHANNDDDSDGPARIVIVGASFAGLGAYRDLLRHKSDEIEITVIDYKDYFEYTPGILRAFVEPNHLSSLTCPLSALNKNKNGASRFVQGEVIGVDATTQVVSLNDGNQIPYDYLIVATGSTYPGPIKATTSQSTLAQRQLSINQSARDIDAANTIIIIGGGAVGVELAAELVDKYRDRQKRVIIIDVAPTILPGFRQHSVDYALRWLEDNGVELRLDTSFDRIDDASVTLSDGSKIFADVIFKCFGVAPATASKYGGRLLSDAQDGPKGSIVVNNHLQVEGQENIFAAGDVCFHSKSAELKLAHTAHVNASLVALNVLRLVRAAKNGTESRSHGHDGLLSYPDGLFGNEQTPKIYNVSLGKYDASLGFNTLVMNGPLPAVVKWLIEWTQVAAAANRPIGLVFWVVADWTSFFLGRTILPMTETAARSKKAQ